MEPGEAERVSDSEFSEHVRLYASAIAADDYEGAHQVGVPLWPQARGRARELLEAGEVVLVEAMAGSYLARTWLGAAMWRWRWLSWSRTAGRWVRFGHT